MYDTIKGYQSIESFSNSDKDKMIYLLDDLSEVRDKFGLSFKGNYNGLSLKITENRFYLSGSLAKYQLGNNISTLNRSSIQESIESLSEAFKIDFGCMNLTRIDLAANFIMKFPIEMYIDRLISLSYYQKMPYENGLYFMKSNEQLVFYGKIQECKKKRVAIPDYWKDTNMLRYEYRLLQRIAKILNVPIVTLSDLYNEEFYINMLKLWEKKYNMILKQKDIVLKPHKSAKSIEHFLAAIGLNTMGVDKCLDMVKEWQSLNEIDKKQAFDLRKKIKDLSINKSFTEECELIKELDMKVSDSIKYFR